MKVIIGNYRPIHLVSRIHDRWTDRRYGDGARFSRDFVPDQLDSWMEKLEDSIQWIYDHSWNILMPKLFSERKIKIRVDKWDSWNADHTIAMIIHPILKQLQDTKHGAPHVENSDVPESLHQPEDFDNTRGDTDANWHERWNWVMNEIIWAFGQLADDNWEEQFYTGDVDFYFEPRPDGTGSEMRFGPNHTFNVDDVGMRQCDARIQNGLRLFAKYYRGLWD